MINGIFDITEADYGSIRASLATESDTRVSEIDGRLITDPPSFYTLIGTALGAPRGDMARVTNADWFYDELTTLCWSDDPNGLRRHQQYVLVIRHPDSVSLDTRWNWKTLLQHAAEFWRDEAEQYVVNGQRRGFAVYLVR